MYFFVIFSINHIKKSINYFKKICILCKKKLKKSTIFQTNWYNLKCLNAISDTSRYRKYFGSIHLLNQCLLNSIKDFIYIRNGFVVSNCRAVNEIVLSTKHVISNCISFRTFLSYLSNIFSYIFYTF